MVNDCKYVILVGDGMADEPIQELGGKTPLEIARTPNMDRLATLGKIGLARTVPEGMNPGSDTANLSIFGYDPKKYYTGRAPLEAISMGIKLGERDAAFRCNLVELADGIMRDFSGGHIDSEYSKIIINEIRNSINRNEIELYPGVSYRNLMVWRDYPCEKIPETTPPHDITDRVFSDFLPAGPCSEDLRNIMEFSREIIKSSETIQNKKGSLKGTANSAWFWGGGFKPAIETLEKRYGLKGYTISAVDLIHGIGRAAGLKPLHVDGATGYIDTNYKGKTNALIEHLSSCNFIFLHVEAPDESGHEGSIEHKIQAIEDFDSKIVGPVWDYIQKFDQYALLVMPDHPTPIRLKTHTDTPVPFIILRNQGFDASVQTSPVADHYSENEAVKTGFKIDEGHLLINLLVKGSLG